MYRENVKRDISKVIEVFCDCILVANDEVEFFEKLSIIIGL